MGTEAGYIACKANVGLTAVLSLGPDVFKVKFIVEGLREQQAGCLPCTQPFRFNPRMVSEH